MSWVGGWVDNAAACYGWWAGGTGRCPRVRHRFWSPPLRCSAMSCGWPSRGGRWRSFCCCLRSCGRWACAAGGGWGFHGRRQGVGKRGGVCASLACADRQAWLWAMWAVDGGRWRLAPSWVGRWPGRRGGGGWATDGAHGRAQLCRGVRWRCWRGGGGCQLRHLCMGVMLTRVAPGDPGRAGGGWSDVPPPHPPDSLGVCRLVRSPVGCFPRS